jgi:hypothetical protein
MGEPRTIFYLRLACEAKCAYVAHPTRAKFLERATAVLGTGNPSTTTADALVERFDESVARRDGAATVFPVPPVAEYLLQRSRSKTELLEELARARKAAQPFRSWCAALENAHRTRAGTAERLRLERQFASALSAWQKDPYDGVRYKRRSIKFSAPLKFLGIDVDGGEIKDPILLKRYTGFRPLLFLNSMINDDVAGGRTLFELLPQE